MARPYGSLWLNPKSNLFAEVVPGIDRIYISSYESINFLHEECSRDSDASGSVSFLSTSEDTYTRSRYYCDHRTLTWQTPVDKLPTSCHGKYIHRYTCLVSLNAGFETVTHLAQTQVANPSATSLPSPVYRSHHGQSRNEPTACILTPADSMYILSTPTFFNIPLLSTISCC